MAIRNIVLEGDDVLRTKCKPVTEFNKRLHELLDDMKETMYKNKGVGLAAPQVGVLRNIFVIDVNDEIGYLEFINPKIISQDGTQVFFEGCLSVPDFQGNVKRPKFIEILAQDRFGEEFTYYGEEVGAVCVSHENDHLNGVLFIDKVIE